MLTLIQYMHNEPPFSRLFASHPLSQRFPPTPAPLAPSSSPSPINNSSMDKKVSKQQLINQTSQTAFSYRLHTQQLHRQSLIEPLIDTSVLIIVCRHAVVCL